MYLDICRTEENSRRDEILLTISIPSGLSKIAFSLFWGIDAHELRQYFCGIYFISHLIFNSE